MTNEIVLFNSLCSPSPLSSIIIQIVFNSSTVSSDGPKEIEALNAGLVGRISRILWWTGVCLLTLSDARLSFFGPLDELDPVDPGDL